MINKIVRRSQYCVSLRAGQSANQIPVRARFSANVQIGPGKPPSLMYNAYRVSFPGIKRPHRGLDHIPPSSGDVKESVELYLYFHSGPS